jgi:hypothetical protein
MNKMKSKILILLCFSAILLLIPSSALAQNLSFSLDTETVNVYWNSDGTLALDYVMVFSNDPFAPPIDFVDIGLPNGNYVLNSVTADVDGQTITNIEDSPYVTGIGLGLGNNAIQPGQTGRVHAYIGTIRQVLHPDSQDDNYASAVFSPHYYDSSNVHGSTDITVTYHFPEGVQPDEPRWHEAPDGFPSTPETGFDNQGRIIYTWRNPNANGYTQYLFGASFPKSYVPADAIARPNPFAWLQNINFEAFIPILCFGFFGLIFILGLFSNRRRKMQYLPPKIAVEGHGIKRGLTAIEAAILMEQPMDKIMTMILFSVIKKTAAEVKSRDPLELDTIKPAPEGLRSYEADFLAAFDQPQGSNRKKALQKMMVDLIRSVGKKMEGFSRKETLAYYRDIMERAWSQVEAADTPEVKSQVFDDVMEWTMLDREFDDRTQDVFRTGPVFVPVWWPRYDPTYSRPSPGPAVPTSSRGPSSSGGPSLPHLPGSDFAASVVGGVQNFSSSVIGSLSDFTSGVTNVTNPPPKPSSSGGFRGGSGGSSCACACACAGCACACAGGGR